MARALIAAAVLASAGIGALAGARVSRPRGAEPTAATSAPPPPAIEVTEVDRDPLRAWIDAIEPAPRRRTTGTIRGRVRDRHGQPVEGPIIRARPFEPSADGDAPFEARLRAIVTARKIESARVIEARSDETGWLVRPAGRP